MYERAGRLTGKNGGFRPEQCDRIDSECLYGNTCNRIFTDYSGVVGCYPAQGQRCFNDGAPCGHQLIEDFEMWVRPARTDQTDTHNTCAKLRHPGAVADLNPGDVRPFYGSTFSRTVGRLYGVTKGLAMWY